MGRLRLIWFSVRRLRHHHLALFSIITALLLDFILGILFAEAEHIPIGRGLFAALGNAVTDGSNEPPHNVIGYLITAVEYITVVPLFAASFSLFTSALNSVHITKASKEIRDHAEDLHVLAQAARCDHDHPEPGT